MAEVVGRLAEGGERHPRRGQRLRLVPADPDPHPRRPGLENEVEVAVRGEVLGVAAVVGFVAADRDLYNAAAVCAGGQVLGTYRKRLLPNYAVFDEERYFTPGSEPFQLYKVGRKTFISRGETVGFQNAEDIIRFEKALGQFAMQRWYHASEATRRKQRIGRPSFWHAPAGTRDRATAMLPGLMRELRAVKSLE